VVVGSSGPGSVAGMPWFVLVLARSLLRIKRSIDMNDEMKTKIGAGGGDDRTNNSKSAVRRLGLLQLCVLFLLAK
jgi:hypothetical protein